MDKKTEKIEQNQLIGNKRCELVTDYLKMRDNCSIL